MPAAGSAAGSGSTALTRPISSIDPELPPATRATYRNLVQRGLAPDEAANLTAFLSGIHLGGAHWKLGEVNRLLFLRRLRLAGRFGADDGAPAPAG